MQLKVTNSPFTEEQAEQLNRLLSSFNEPQIQWLSGYLAFYQHTAAANGSNAASQVSAAVEAAPRPAETAVAVVEQPVVREATVLFGSQTGNAQKLAGKLAAKLEEQGFAVTLAAMNNYKNNELKKTANLFIIVSTHGEGDPPDNAIPFYEFVHGKRAPKLEGLKYSVLALGDTSYEFFCKTGKDFDERLAELGAQRLMDRVDCDLDYDEPAAEWFGKVVGALNAASAGGGAAAAGAAASSAASALAVVESEYSRTNPFQAEILANLNLNGRGSDRETRHLELSLEGSNLQYEPGDIVGIIPENDASLVDRIIESMGWSAEEQVAADKNSGEVSLRTALLRYFEITVLTRPLLEKAAAFSENGKLAELLLPDKKQELKDYLYGRDLLDLLEDFKPWKVKPSEFISILRKLPPREYSIASSLKANPDEVHLTIRKVEYDSHGRERKGVCSVQVAERAEEGSMLPIFIKHNPNFKLPADPDAPIIMIGPGTGVAPFRAFLGEREEDGAAGKSWLFYGDRHFVTDFLYQTEWQRWLKDGVLTKLDVAFSRDSDEKVYVQHRMLEHASELYQWLQEGAYVYVCGDEKYMAHDVHAALLQIIEQEGGLSEEAAAAYLSDLQQQRRYQRDVY